MIRSLTLNLVIVLTLMGCGRIKDTGGGLIRKAKGKVNDKIDQYFHHFDSYEADTKYNKRRFREFFGFAPTEDVKDLYAHASEIGIDASYHIAFTGDKATAERIIKELDMKKDITNMSFSGGFNLPYDWWDTERIHKLQPYSKEERNLYWYLWYDSENHKTYFLTFDI